MMDNRNHHHIAGLALLLFGVVLRLLPHAPNITPITAIAFAGSLYLDRRWVVLLPCLALFISDLFIGFYDWRIALSVYGSFAIISFFSRVAVSCRAQCPLVWSVVGASLLFFLVTNGAVWAFSPWYEKSAAGLLYAYELGLPFLRNMLVGDLCYTGVLIAAFEGARVLRALPRPFVGFGVGVR